MIYIKQGLVTKTVDYSSGNTVEKTSVNGQTKTITTGTDKDGKSFVSNDGVTNETSTDDFGRTTQVRTVRSDGTLVFNTDYEYADGKAENSTTNLISKFSQSYGSDSVLSYDSNGNITEIRQNGELKLINKYSYDTSYGNFLLPYEVTLLYFLHFGDQANEFI